ncbi:tail fiber domain-containing protein [bacterium]|nr:tail fiber domain-containing protein [bacterium]
MRLTSPGNLNVRGNVVANSVILSSDRNAKKDFRSVEPQSVLDKLAALPVSEWSYKSDPSVRHLGPMAQDFHAAFGVGPDDRHIATVDADGVALAAIQGLNGKFEDEMERKDDEIASLKQAITDLRRSVEALARKSEGGAK